MPSACHPFFTDITTTPSNVLSFYFHFQETIQGYCYYAPNYPEELAKWRNKDFYKATALYFQLPFQVVRSNFLFYFSIPFQFESLIPFQFESSIKITMTKKMRKNVNFFHLLWKYCGFEWIWMMKKMTEFYFDFVWKCCGFEWIWMMKKMRKKWWNFILILHGSVVDLNDDRVLAYWQLFVFFLTADGSRVHSRGNWCATGGECSATPGYEPETLSGKTSPGRGPFGKVAELAGFGEEERPEGVERWHESTECSFGGRSPDGNRGPDRDNYAD